MVKRLFLAVPQGCLWFVIVVFPDHTHLLFFLPLKFGIPIDFFFFFGSPTFFCDMVAVWRIVKLALKNKHTYFREFFFVPYNAFLLLIAYDATEGMSGVS